MNITIARNLMIKELNQRGAKWAWPIEACNNVKLARIFTSSDTISSMEEAEEIIIDYANSLSLSYQVRKVTPKKLVAIDMLDARKILISKLIDCGYKKVIPGMKNRDLARLYTGNSSISKKGAGKIILKLVASNTPPAQTLNESNTKKPVCNKPKKKLKVGHYKNYAKVSAEFFSSKAWQDLRYRALVKYGGICMLCGNRPPNCVIHVDHIKPRYKYPELELEFSNLQILCATCNISKSYKYEDDFRPKEPTLKKVVSINQQ